MRIVVRYSRQCLNYLNILHYSKATSVLALVDKGAVENDRRNHDNRTARQEGIHLFLRLSSKCFSNPLLYFPICDSSLYKKEGHRHFNIYIFSSR